MKQYTKNEFFKKTDWEGGLEGMASYAGPDIEITDDPELTGIWRAFALSWQDLQDYYDEWDEAQSEFDFDD